MSKRDKKTEDIVNELQNLKQKYDALKISYEAVKKERKEAQFAKNLSEINYRLLAQNSSDVIWTLDNDYRFTYISPSIRQLRGLTPEEAINETIQDTMTPQSLEDVYQTIVKGKENERIKNYVPAQVEIEQYHKDGHLIWVEIYIRAMLNDLGEKIGYVGISRNISERKLAEKALKESLERFDGLVTKVPVGIYIFWIRAGGHMEFEYVSDRWCEIHKITRQEALDDVSLVHKFIHKDDVEHFMLLNQNAAIHRKTFNWEGRFFRGRELRWFHIESIPIGYDNGDIQWYGVTQDITDRKRSEEKLRESEAKLRELNAQKDKFFSIIAHDLKSPFNSILGFSQLLIDQINQKDYNGIEEYAKIIRQSSQRAMDLLMNLLEWSRAHTGRMKFKPETIELVNLINENIMIFDIIAGQKNITINKNFTPIFMPRWWMFIIRH